MDNKTKEEIPQWILDYDKQNHQSSAGKAIRILLQSTKHIQDELDSWKKEHFEMVEDAANTIKELQDRVKELEEASDNYQNFFQNMTQRLNESHEQQVARQQARIQELENALEDSKDTLYWVKEKYFERNYGQPKLYATYNQVVLEINKIKKLLNTKS